MSVSQERLEKERMQKERRKHLIAWAHRLHGEGKTNAEIGKQLHVSESTVAALLVTEKEN